MIKLPQIMNINIREAAKEIIGAMNFKHIFKMVTQKDLCSFCESAFPTS